MWIGRDVTLCLGSALKGHTGIWYNDKNNSHLQSSTLNIKLAGSRSTENGLSVTGKSTSAAISIQQIPYDSTCVHWASSLFTRQELRDQPDGISSSWGLSILHRYHRKIKLHVSDYDFSVLLCSLYLLSSLFKKKNLFSAIQNLDSIVSSLSVFY